MAAPQGSGQKATKADFGGGDKEVDAYKGSQVQTQVHQKIDVNQQSNIKASFQSNMTLETDTVQTVQSSSKAANAPIIQVVEQEAVVMENNDISTVSVPQMSCEEAMSKMQGVLGAYKGEINFSSDEEKMEIGDGLVFIDGFYAVHFKILTFTDAKTKSTRWEFRRMQGSAMASAKFLGQIKTAFFENAAESAENEEDGATALEALPLSTDDMKMELSKDQEEMMMIHEALIGEEVGIEMDEAAENYLTSKMVEAGAISKDVAVDSSKLVQALMADAVMKHKDVAVQRAALMMLAKFAKEHGKAMVAAGLPATLQAASKATQYASIQKRADALSKLISE